MEYNEDFLNEEGALDGEEGTDESGINPDEGDLDGEDTVE